MAPLFSVEALLALNCTIPSHEPGRPPARCAPRAAVTRQFCCRMEKCWSRVEELISFTTHLFPAPNCTIQDAHRLDVRPALQSHGSFVAGWKSAGRGWKN